jgi:hypothetical protein
MKFTDFLNENNGFQVTGSWTRSLKRTSLVLRNSQKWPEPLTVGCSGVFCTTKQITDEKEEAGVKKGKKNLLSCCVYCE